jgi:hypothetical protein
MMAGRRWTGEDWLNLLMVLVYVWAVADAPPVRVLLWHYTRVAAQKIAHVAGTIGLYAESKYYDAIGPVS